MPPASSASTLLPLQPGDVPKTYADITALERDYGFRPSTPLREGVRRFVEWYREYHGLGMSGRGALNDEKNLGNYEDKKLGCRKRRNL